MAYTIKELNGSGKRVVLTERNGREDALDAWLKKFKPKWRKAA